MDRTRISALPALAALLATGCGAASGPGAEGIYRDPSAPVEARVDALLSVMTLEEKVAQMHGTPTLDGSGLWPTADDARLGIPGFRMVDGPRGVSRNAGVATAFPVGAARGATFDVALERRVGQAIAAEARARGANVLLAPTMNLVRHPRWGRAQETYGEDSFHVGAMAAGFVQGAQEHVIAVAKHFAANSIEDVRSLVDVRMDDRTLREVYLPHFRRAVEAGVGSVMTAYNQVNGAYCAENRTLVAGILEGEWGFDGFVMSDWVFGTRSTVPSVLAGLDLEMPWAQYYGDALVAAVRSGAAPVAAVDGAVRRILRAKIRSGILDGRAPLDPAVEIESAPHVALAREVAERSIVLLKNDGALPLVRESLRQVAVVGMLAATANTGDTGSSAAASSHVVTPLEGMRALAGGVTVLDVARDALSPADRALVAGADAAVVVVGLTAADEGEADIGAGDRASLELSATHQALVAEVAALNPRTIVILEGSGPLIVEGFVDRVPAIGMAWYPGREGGNAIAAVLFGDVNPSGRLPVSFPRSEAQLPPFVNDRTSVTYGYLHGYRHLDAAAEEPRFPFGTGLGYTTFSFANLRLDPATTGSGGTVHVTVEVTNRGAVAGDEVVQLYVGYPGSAVTRAPRDLKGFARVSLAPGETRTVGLDLAVRDLAFWDAARGAFTVEPLPYRVQVGNGSRSLPLEAVLTVTP